MTRYTGDNNNNVFIAPNDGLAWVMSGKGGDDILIGGNNNDVIDGDEGYDTLYGRGGNDIINGGEGYDYIYGEDGDDILVDTQGSVDGGAGIDFLKADYSLFDNGAGIHVGWLGYNIIFSRVDGSGLLTYNNIERFEITGTKYNDVLQGGDYNDNLNGGAGDDEIFGGAGNDNLDGGAGFDYLNGGDGNDNLTDIQGIVDGGAGTDTLRADYSLFNNGVGIEVGYNGESAIYSKYNSSPSDINFGNDYLYSPSVLLRYSNVERFEITGTQYNDILRGGDYNDNLNGGAGDDEIFGGAGFDTLNGGDGNDILIDIDGTVDGGAGIDTLVADYSQLNSGAGINGAGIFAVLSRGRIDNLLTGGSILINYTNIEQFHVTGTQYADLLDGGDRNDILNGGDGDDILNGGAGIDTLNGGNGNDVFLDISGTVDGGAGIDTLIANYSQFDNGVGINLNFWHRTEIYSNSSTIPLLDYTSIEQFNVAGTQYADLLIGGDRNDTLYGGAGNDGIGGGWGYDYLFGGDGDDILGDIDGTVDGGAGNDTLIADYKQFNNGVGIEVGYNGENAIYSNDNSIPLGSSLGYNASLLLAYSDIEQFNITGTQYADKLRGGGGNDVLNGGAGNDVLIGGLGNDILTGGIGADEFLFNSVSEGIDVIKDFNWQQGDTIQIIGSSFGATSTSQFNFNFSTGALSFNGQQFAILENISNSYDFIPSLDIVIV